MKPASVLKFHIVIMTALLVGCVSLPANVTPVDEFELDRYLGTWYEIARLDHKFERGLEQVSATYSMREDGGVKVLNKGYSPSKGEWNEAEGKAYFVESSDQGFLKVSFFGPFYGSYVVFELDKENYQQAYVAGPDESYLWYLSRTPTVTEQQLDAFIKRAESAGFNTEDIIIVDQD